MQTDDIIFAEQRLNRLANLAIYHQGFWMFIVALLLVFKPHFIKEAGQCLGISALLASGIASKIYIQAGKKVEEFKQFTPDEAKERLLEYRTRFFAPYFLWAGIIILFSRFC